VQGLDEKVMNSRKIYEKENHGKTGPHPHRRGNPTNTLLPKMKNTERKIPMFAIDQHWLENHPECNRPTRIEDWQEDTIADGEVEASNDEEEDYGDQE
jgi:hypothetical protein